MADPVITQIKSLVRNIPTAATWPKERDRLGGKSNLVQSVNVSKSLGKFHDKFDAEQIEPSRQAIAALLKELTKYAKEVKKGHPKLHDNLQKSVISSLTKIDEILVDEPQERRKQIAKLWKILDDEKLNFSTVLSAEKLPEDRKAEFRQEWKAYGAACKAAKAEVDRAADWPSIDRYEELHDAAQDLLKAISAKWMPLANFEPDFDDAEEHWNRCIIPGLIGQANELFAVGFGEQVELAGTDGESEKLVGGLCSKLRAINDRRFDPILHNTPTRKKANELHASLMVAGRKLMGDAIAAVAKGKGEADTQYLRFRLPKQGPENLPRPKKQVGILSTKTTDEAGEAYTKAAARVTAARTFKDVAKALDTGYFPHKHHFTMKVAPGWRSALDKLDGALRGNAQQNVNRVLGEAREELKGNEAAPLKTAIEQKLAQLLQGLPEQ